MSKRSPASALLKRETKRVPELPIELPLANLTWTWYQYDSIFLLYDAYAPYEEATHSVTLAKAEVSSFWRTSSEPPRRQS